MSSALRPRGAAAVPSRRHQPPVRRQPPGHGCFKVKHLPRGGGGVGCSVHSRQEKSFDEGLNWCTALASLERQTGRFLFSLSQRQRFKSRREVQRPRYPGSGAVGNGCWRRSTACAYRPSPAGVLASQFSWLSMWILLSFFFSV